MPFRINIQRAFWAFVAFGWMVSTTALGTVESVTLQYAHGGKPSQVQVLQDIKGKKYLPLLEVARFYGVQVQFDSQTRKVVLSKGNIRANLVLSQPVFMVSEPEMSVPIDPVEVVSGQLAIPPASVEDAFGTLLDNQVSYSADQRTITAGGVRTDELRSQTQALNLTAPTAVPAIPTAVGVTQVAVPTAVPTLEEETDETEETHVQQLGEEPPANKMIRARRIVIDAGHGGN
ncbi:MAG TPA: stalk domain-containing protein, partial [bacterium]|nr:stalk domain-containing protein [bacterium]